MRLIRPVRVRPPWRSSESWSLSVSKVDSIHWRMPPSEPKRGGSSLRSGRSRSAAERVDVLLELGAGEAFVGDHDLSRFAGRARAVRRRRRARARWRGRARSRPGARRVSRAGRAGSPRTSGCASGSSRSRRARPALSGARSRARPRTAPASSRAACSRSQNDGDSLASSVIASSSCGASARSRLLNPDWPGMYGNRCPRRRLASRRKRRSFGQSSSTCATARQISSLSEIRGGGPQRAVWPAGDHRPARKRTVSKASRSADTVGLLGRRCIDTADFGAAPAGPYELGINRLAE